MFDLDPTIEDIEGTKKKLPGRPFSKIQQTRQTPWLERPFFGRGGLHGVSFVRNVLWTTPVNMSLPKFSATVESGEG